MNAMTTDPPLAAPGPRPLRSDMLLLALLASVPLAVQLIALLTPGYSYFIDEFYYLACARRLAFGYVDHPPLAAAILALTRPVLGDSLLGIRLVPFLAGSATVWVTGLLVRRLGGGRFALILAALSVGLTPVLLSLTGFFSMNAFEPLLWSLTLLALVRLVQTGNSRLWLLVGLLIGLGFENKHTVVAFVVALGVGIVATRARRMLLDRWLWAGAAVAFAIALPNLWWQVANGWPSLEFYRNAQLEKNVYSPPLRSFLALVVVANPLTFPIWAAGLAWLAARGNSIGTNVPVGRGNSSRSNFRFLAVASLIVILEYLVSGSSRPDRPMAAFPFLLAAGGVAVEQWIRRPALRASLAVLVVAFALALAPLGIPLLSPDALARYVHAIGLRFQVERGKTSPLPQLLADRTGWESFLDDATRAYDALSPEDRKRAVFYVPDYGHAGALELWGAKRGLPRVIASQNSYWHWSNGHVNTPVLIAVDHDTGALNQLFADVRKVGTVECEYCMSWRSHMGIWVARSPIIPVDRVWARARHYE
jgi:hypothetical protein